LYQKKKNQIRDLNNHGQIDFLGSETKLRKMLMTLNIMKLNNLVFVLSNSLVVKNSHYLSFNFTPLFFH